MGVFSSKKKQTNQTDQQTNSTSTSTPNVPDWLLNPAQKLAGGVQGFMGQDSSAYAPQVSDLQSQAFGDAGKLTTSPYIGQAADQVKGINYDPAQVSGGTVNPESLLDGLDRYYTPFKSQVLNPVLDDYDVQSGKTRAAQAAQAAGSGAFRGSRYGVREAQTEGELARGRAATEGGLLDDMFKTSTSLSSQDAARRQSASEGNAARALAAASTNAGNGIAANGQRLQGAGLLENIGQALGSESRANLAVQDTMGGQKTDLENQARKYPLEYQKTLEGLFAGLDPSLFTGQTSTGSGTVKGTTTASTSGSLGSFLGDLLLAGAGGGASLGGLAGLLKPGNGAALTKDWSALASRPTVNLG